MDVHQSHTCAILLSPYTCSYITLKHVVLAKANVKVSLRMSMLRKRYPPTDQNHQRSMLTAMTKKADTWTRQQQQKAALTLNRRRYISSSATRLPRHARIPKPNGTDPKGCCLDFSSAPRSHRCGWKEWGSGKMFSS